MLFLDVDDRHHNWLEDMANAISATTPAPGSWNMMLNAKLSLLYKKRGDTRVTFKLPWPWVATGFNTVVLDFFRAAFPIATAGNIAYGLFKIEGFQSKGKLTRHSTYWKNRWRVRCRSQQVLFVVQKRGGILGSSRRFSPSLASIRSIQSYHPRWFGAHGWNHDVETQESTRRLIEGRSKDRCPVLRSIQHFDYLLKTTITKSGLTLRTSSLKHYPTPPWWKERLRHNALRGCFSTPLHGICTSYAALPLHRSDYTIIDLFTLSDISIIIRY